MSNDYLIKRRIRHQKLLRRARRVEFAVIRTYKLIRFFFSILIIYLIYLFATSQNWYLPDDIYTNKNTQNLEILGNSIVKKEKIIEVMKKVPLEKKPVYKLNPTNISREIEKLNPIKRAYVRRFWFPARLVVMTEEVVPVFVIAPSEEAPEVAAFAKTGELITREYLPLDKKFKAIKILSYGNQGDDYTKWNLDKITELYDLCELIQLYSGENIEYLDLRQKKNIFVKINSAKIKLGEIDSTINERVRTLYDILPTIKSRKDKIKYVDLSWRDSIYLKENK